MKAFVSKTSAAIFIVGLCTLIGCSPARDSKGRNPSEVVDRFVQAVNSNDFTAAKSYWEQGAIEAIEFRYSTNFEAFCEQKFRCSSHFTKQPTKQKMDFWSIEFFGKLSGKTNSYMLYLHQVGGEWKLHFSRGM